ncbi:AAA family ATPase [uncultured Acetatifactor sp.]|uniref:AAA family ATPase n=1 Tax=uncultured Acetatifactor sp. TaxID=1671927 RepID=UPI00261E252C|nr:AAA family ATPase [uncultured Acetatifactor sp.]
MDRYLSVEKNLAKYIDAGFPMLYIRTYEEEKADRHIQAAAGRREVLEWNGADGFVNFKTKSPLIPNQSLESTLAFLKNGKELDRKLFVVKDAARELESGKVAALLKEIARKIRTGAIDTSVIIVSPALQIPKELESLVTVMELGLPDEKEIYAIIGNFLEQNEIDGVYQGLLDEMSTAFKGLSESEIRDLLSLAVSSDGELTRKSLQLIFDQKQQMILKAGILEMVPLKESIDDIGGLENLKEWLRKKAAVFKDIRKAAEFGVTMPKGVLIAGVPGCGKSLSAKAAGKLFDVPLLRLDMGRLMGKYVGESEENMRKAIRLAEAISPCVLWVDELEKAFAGIGSGGSGSEVTTRLFGAFLTWMQEKTSPAFVVATANDITKLPPELMRKGRFDEIFYVALPNPEERRRIFEIHLRKRRKDDVDGIDLEKLVGETEGYSGADIEGVVGESVESAFVKGSQRLATGDIEDCIRNTQSLSEIMKEPLKEMAKIYEERKFKKASR